MFTFEKLDVWQKAIDFADLVYNYTRNFPTDERFGLTNQMRRAAVSISSNIAEGTSRMSQTDFARFIESARKPSSARNPRRRPMKALRGLRKSLIST
jgi:hypothetical protein